MQRLLLLLLAIVGAVIWVRRLFRVVRAQRPSPASAGRQRSPRAGDAMVRDRICNTFIPRARALSEMHGSEQVYFCSEECRRTFLAQR